MNIYQDGIDSEHFVLEHLDQNKKKFKEFGKIVHIHHYDGNKKADKEKQLQGIDADLVCIIKGKVLIIPIDVKQDTYLGTNGKILIEWWDYNPGRKKGWGQYSKSEYIVWHATNEPAIYITNLEQFRLQTQFYIHDNPRAQYVRVNRGGGRYTLNHVMAYRHYGKMCSRRYEIG